MNCSELAGDYELYALGVLEEPDRGELREHLSRNCQVCTAEVRRAAVRVSALSSLAPEAELPKDLRKRVLASVGIHPQFRWNWMQTWATIAACAVLGMFWVEHLRRERIREVALQDAMQQVKQSEEVLALLNSPETIVRVSSEGAALALWRACSECGLRAWCYQFRFPESLTWTVTIVDIDGMLQIPYAFVNVR